MSVKKTIATAGSAGVIACCVAFTPIWEGMDKVAKKDLIGTGHPITYCYGQTSEFGDVKVGQRFTKQQCDEKLAESLPEYLEKIEPCIHVDMPDKTKASLLDAAWNAGAAAVCRSPMVAKMNAGDLEGGCNAFAGWYIRSDGKVRTGLIDRRDGEDHGDHRQSEKGLCLEGLREVAAEPDPEPRIVYTPPPAPAVVAAPTPAIAPSRPARRKRTVRPAPAKVECAWWQKCPSNLKQ